jgi:cupin-like protein
MNRTGFITAETGSAGRRFAHRTGVRPMIAEEILVQPAAASRAPNTNGHRVSVWSDLGDTPTPSFAVERRNGLGYDEFIRDHVRGNRPVILTDVTKHWKALARWTPEFFREQYGSIEINVEGQKEPLGSFIDEVLASRFDRPGRYAYSMSIPRQFPELLADIDPQPRYWHPNWLYSRYVLPIVSDHKLCNVTGLEINIGGAGSAFPQIHYDELLTETFVVQIHGRKEWVLYSPDQTPYMYPKSAVSNFSTLTVKDGIDLDEFPEFRKVRPVRFFIEPGEMFYNPPGWWHTTRALTPSIALVLTIARGPIWSGVTKSTCAWTLHTDERSRPIVLAKVAAIFTYMTAFRAVQTVLDAFRPR